MASYLACGVVAVCLLLSVFYITYPPQNGEIFSQEWMRDTRSSPTIGSTLTMLSVFILIVYSFYLCLGGSIKMVRR